MKIFDTVAEDAMQKAVRIEYNVENLKNIGESPYSETNTLIEIKP